MRKNVQKPCKIMSCKNHAKTMPKPCQNHAKNKLFHMLQKTSCSTCHAKTMQKLCNMRCVRWRLHRASGAAGRLRRARQGGYAGRGNPLNIHSPPGPCYMCYMCYISQGKPLNIHPPPGPCYMCYMCYISQGKPLNIHSPPGPCYMCYMCYMALYSIYSTDFARTEYIAHIVHIARSWGRVGVQRLYRFPNSSCQVATFHHRGST